MTLVVSWRFLDGGNSPVTWLALRYITIGPFSLESINFNVAPSILVAAGITAVIRFQSKPRFTRWKRVTVTCDHFDMRYGSAQSVVLASNDSLSHELGNEKVSGVSEQMRTAERKSGA